MIKITYMYILFIFQLLAAIYIQIMLDVISRPFFEYMFSIFTYCHAFFAVSTAILLIAAVLEWGPDGRLNFARICFVRFRFHIIFRKKTYALVFAISVNKNELKCIETSAFFGFGDNKPLWNLLKIKSRTITLFQIHHNLAAVGLFMITFATFLSIIAQTIIFDRAFYTFMTDWWVKLCFAMVRMLSFIFLE